MKPRASRKFVFTFLFVLLSIQPIFGEEIHKKGEFQINTFTTGYQGYPAVAVDGNGNFVTVWESFPTETGDASGVFGQRFQADGSPEGSEFQLNTYTTGFQWNATVAADSQGNFVAAWESDAQGDGLDIFGQLYDSAGAEVGGEFQINTFTTNDQTYPAVAMGTTGDFLMVWQSNTQDLSLGGIYGQLYGSAGNAIGNEFLVNSTTNGEQIATLVAATNTGFIVVWESAQLDGNGQAVAMQRFDDSANPVGDEFQVNVYTTGNQEDPSIAVANDGNFAVVWEDSVQDNSTDAIFGRVFDSSGAALTGEFQINTYTTDNQENPRVAADGDGGFLAVWESAAQVDGTPDEDIFAQRFDASGQLVGQEFRVNDQASNDQEYPAIAGGAQGRFIVVWHSAGAFDGSETAVYGQQLEISLFADGFESGNITAWSNSVP